MSSSSNNEKEKHQTLTEAIILDETQMLRSITQL